MAKADCSELATTLTNMAMEIAKQPGMNTVKAVLGEVNVLMEKAGGPAIDRETFEISIVEATTARHELKTDIASINKRLLKKEVGVSKVLRAKIKTFEKHDAEGTRPKGGPPKEDMSSAWVRLHREILADLKKRVGPSEHTLASADAKRLAVVEGKITSLEKRAAAGAFSFKGAKPKVASQESAALVAAKAELATLEKAEGEKKKAFKRVGRRAKADKKAIAAAKAKVAELRAHDAAGTRPEGGERVSRASKELLALRSEQKELRAKVGPSEYTLTKREEKKVAGINARIETVKGWISDKTTRPDRVTKNKTDSEQMFGLKEELKEIEAEYNATLPAQRERLAGQMERAIAKYEAVRHTPPVNREKAPIHPELMRATVELSAVREATRAEIASQRPKGFAWYAAESMDVARNIMTGGELSAMARQGGIDLLSHPIRSVRDVAPQMIKALGFNKKTLGAALKSLKEGDPKSAAATMAEPAEKIHAAIREHKDYPEYVLNGGFISEGGSSDLTKHEEAIQSNLSKYLPVVASSNRAYSAYLDVLRINTYAALKETLTVDGTVTPTQAKLLANFINIKTGRGSFAGSKKLENAGPLMARLFFAPRNFVSRFQYLLGTPLWKAAIGKNRDAAVAKLIATEYVRFYAGLSILLALFGLGADEFEEDLTSSDFGKAIFGHTRVDTMAGLVQAAVFTKRVLSGEKKSASGKVVDLRGEGKAFGVPGVAGVIGRFFWSKASPPVSAAINILNGQNVVGEKSTIASEAWSMLHPMTWGDIEDALKEHGAAKGTALGLLAFIGMGVSTYGRIDVNDPEEFSKALRRLTNPSEDAGDWGDLEGVTYEEGKAALKAGAMAKYEAAKAKAAEERKKGKRVKRVARPKFGTKAFRARLRKLREGLASRE